MLPLIVVVVVVCVLGIVGVTGYLIDQSAERHDKANERMTNDRR
jgi:hypothetical protein